MNLDWITPRLAVGGAPSAAMLDDLVGAGLKAVVDLRDEACDDGAALAVRGLGFLHLPTPDNHAPLVAQLDEGVEFVRAQAGAVLIHCREGVGRSATLALCVLVDGGEPPLAALRRAKDARWQVSPSLIQYAGWSAWLTSRGMDPPAFEAFAAVAYRHLG